VDIPLHNYAPALSPAAGNCHPEAPAPTGDRPAFLIHCGAQIAVRRWPASHLRHLIAFLRRDFEFRLVLVPDPDGYGSELSDLADFVPGPLTLGGLVDLIASCDLVICNDSAPAHIASALGKRVIAFFGPQLPERFAPYGSENLVVIRDLCEFRPCSDSCRFAEPKCLTQLSPEMAWTDIKPYLEKHFASCRHDSSSKHPVD
jgi:ADP-heptose:LPS heptosyltransferase